MTKELSTTEQEQLKEYRDLMFKNKGNRTNRIAVENSIFIKGTEDKNPNFGKLMAYSYLDGEEKVEALDITKVEFFPVAMRVQISCTKYVDGKPLYYCKEVDEGEPIELLDQDKNVVYEGFYKGLTENGKEAKEEFELKYQQAIYVHLVDEKGKVDTKRLFRFKFGGSGNFNTWFKVKSAHEKLGRPATIKITKIEKKSFESTRWNDMTFELGSPVDLTVALPLIHQANQGLAEYYAGKNQQEQVKEIASAEEADLVPDDVPWETTEEDVA